MYKWKENYVSTKKETYLLSPNLLYNNTRKQKQQLSLIPLNEQHHASDITTKDRRQFLVTLLSYLYWFT